MYPFFSALRSSVLLLLVLALLAGCIASPIPKPASRIGSGVYQGTGFLVSPDGLVLTAYHVIEDGNTIKVRCQGYDLVPAKLGAHSRTMDLAVLHTGLSGTPFLRAAAPRAVRPGNPVFSMGFPSASYLGTDPKYFTGAVSSLTGGGRDAVVGVVTAGTNEEAFIRDSGALPQNLNWAVKMEYATPLYELPVRPEHAVAVRAPREVAEEAARAVCIVLVGP